MMPKYKLIKIYAPLEASNYWEAKQAFEKLDKSGEVNNLLTWWGVKEDDHQKGGWVRTAIKQVTGK